MGICDSKKKEKKRLPTFEDIDQIEPQKSAEPPPAKRGGEFPKDPDSEKLPTKTLTTPKKKKHRGNFRIPSEKLSLIDRHTTLTAAIRETNFFQNEVDDEFIQKLYTDNSGNTFSTETLAKLLEEYVNICANFAKKEIQYQKEKLRKVRKENKLDQRPNNFSPMLDPGPLVSRQATGGMFGAGDRSGISADDAQQIFAREAEQMRHELAADLAKIENEEDSDSEHDDPGMLTIPSSSDFMPTRDDSVIEMRKSLGDANLQRKCGETIVTCNSFLSQLRKNPELMLAGVPRTMDEQEFSNFLPNFLESYAKELGVFEVEEMAATRSCDSWNSGAPEPLEMGDLNVSVFILSMSCFDVDLPWDPVDYKIAKGQSVRQMVEHLFQEHEGLEAYKEKFRTTLVQRGKIVDVPEWHSTMTLEDGEELTINF